MKRVETASDGSQVITLMAHIQQSDCYVLVQEIKNKTMDLELRSTITLSRADIEAIHDYLDDQPSS